MKGNFQVRFLEGSGLATARFHSARGKRAVRGPNQENQKDPRTEEKRSCRLVES